MQELLFLVAFMTPGLTVSVNDGFLKKNKNEFERHLGGTLSAGVLILPDVIDFFRKRKQYYTVGMKKQRGKGRMNLTQDS